MANPGAIIFSNDPRKGTRNIAWQMLKRVTPYYVIPLSFAIAPIVFPTSLAAIYGYADIDRDLFPVSQIASTIFPAWAGYIVVPLEEKRSVLIKNMEYFSRFFFLEILKSILKETRHFLISR